MHDNKGNEIDSRYKRAVKAKNQDLFMNNFVLNKINKKEGETCKNLRVGKT